MSWASQTAFQALGQPNWGITAQSYDFVVPGQILCRQSYGQFCLDGTGLSAAGVKGIIAGGVIFLVILISLGCVLLDRFNRSGRVRSLPDHHLSDSSASLHSLDYPFARSIQDLGFLTKTDFFQLLASLPRHHFVLGVVGKMKYITSISVGCKTQMANLRDPKTENGRMHICPRFFLQRVSALPSKDCQSTPTIFALTKRSTRSASQLTSGHSKSVLRTLRSLAVAGLPL